MYPPCELFNLGVLYLLNQTLGVPEQAIGPIVERKFENGKGVTWRRLIIKRKINGVDDGFRTRDLRIHNPAL